MLEQDLYFRQSGEIREINSGEIDLAIISAAQLLSEHGGRALLVGGGVRDMIAGFQPKDFDIEVYGLNYESIQRIVGILGKVNTVGKSFGVIKVTNNQGFDLDISIPRKDSKIGIGHTGFESEFDESMDITSASKRRDFTINSIMFDPLTGEILDPHNGIADLKNKILRVTDSALFADDPLRIMRALQFAGRFDLEVERESFEIMEQMVVRLEELPKERLLEEWKKLLLKSEKPSKGLQLGMELGIFHVLHPEFVDLLDTPQEEQWHPEGDVWTHTLMSVDQAAKIIKDQNLDEDRAWTFMLSVLCHDLGKPISTEINEDGKIISYGHDKAGVVPASKFLKRIGVDLLTSEKVLKLVENHMWPHMNYADFVRGQNISDGAFRKLASKLFPATIEELALLGHADGTGTGFYGSLQSLAIPATYPESEWLLSRANQIGVSREKPKDIILGRDLIEMGFKPGKEFGEVIRFANNLRDEKGFDYENLLQIISNHTNINDLISDLNARLNI